MLRLTLIAVLLSLAPGLAAQEPRIYGYEVVNTYPHEITAFTQGLMFRDGELWEGTGKHGLSRLSRVDLETGEALESVPLASRYFGEGIEMIGDRIYQLTWRAHMVFVYDRESLEPLETLYNAREGWGLAWDGEHLILSDGSASLQFIDPEGFAPVREIGVTVRSQPLAMLNELEYIDGEVWANVWQTDFIVRIDPATGVVNSIVDLTGLSARTELGSGEAVLNGIAWDSDGERLFVTGKHWAHLFEIELIERGP